MADTHTVNTPPHTATAAAEPSTGWALWLYAMRPRTLPLAAAGILAGAMLAWQQHTFHANVLAAALSTALLLQIFSNLANDYGDAVHGADRHRQGGPLRVVAAGLITPAQMRRALMLCTGLCMGSGLWLLFLALPALNGLAGQWWWWLGLGALALLAAWTYTAGKRPYGYAGWGDVSVWLFFGWLAVLGSATLQGAHTSLPAVAVANALGLWCAAVLNINNMRDIRTDLAAGKHTIAARLGAPVALYYHAALMLLAALCWMVWLWHSLPGVAGAVLGCLLLLFYRHHGHRLRQAQKQQHADAHNRQLAQLSLFVLLWVAVNWLLLYWFQAA